MDFANSPPLHVIVLEDNPVDAELIERALSRSDVVANFQRVITEREFAAAIGGDAPDLVLADYTLPEFDGLTALRLLRERHPDVPFIFVSGSLGEERAVDALKSGATEYVLKDHLQHLPSIVKRALTEARERHERRLAEAALEQQRVLLTVLIDNLPEYIYAVDAASRITVINRAMLARLNISRNAALGRRLSELLTSEVARDMELQDAMVLNSGRSMVDQEHASEAGDGSMLWLISSRIPLRDHQNKVIGVVCTERDMTARKELEQEILDISNREQRRLGSDLHDGLGQELTGLSLMLKGLEVQLSREAPVYLPQIAKISALLSRTIQSTRSLARGLAPVNLERGGLREALRQLAARCSDVYNLACSFNDEQAHIADLDESLATHLYRIAQEATTNAARHARATSIQIELRSTARRLYLSITDDGVGLEATRQGGHVGMGLKIMEYRARTVGGTINFESLKKGTRVALSCPLTLLRKRRTPTARQESQHKPRLN